MTRRLLAAALLLVPFGAAAAPPPNDECAGATLIASIPFTATQDVADATAVGTDPDFDCPGGGAGLPGVWYAYTASAPVSLQIDTFGSDYDTQLLVYGGACGAETGPLDCNNDDYDLDNPESTSRVVITLAAGETALIEVRSWDAPFGGTSLTLNVTESPVFRVTPFAEYSNERPSIARRGSEFLVVWRHDTYPDSVRARRYDSAGVALVPPFQVSTSSAGYSLPDVAATDDGFVVAWWAAGAGITAQRLDGSGAPVGGEIAVSTSGTYRIAVAAAPGGEFMVVWADDSVEDDYGVLGRAFDGAGAPAGPAFQVNAYTTFGQFDPDVAADGAGNFTVVWTSGPGINPSPGPDGESYGVFGRRFDVAGSALGGEFQVNTYTSGNQELPAVAAASGGEFTVAWTDSGDGDCFLCVDARRFDAAGSPLGAVVRLGDEDTGTYGFVGNRPLGIAADDLGNFVVVWPGNDIRVVSRRLGPAGALGPPFTVSHIRDGYQYHPKVAAAANGDFVVVWDWSPYGSKYDVMGRHVRVAESGICTATPRDALDCHQVTIPGKSKLNLRDRSPDAGDTVTWKWVRGDETTLGDLGDPLATDSYAVCAYDTTGRVLEVAVGPGATCGPRPCWTSLGADGFRYVDKRATQGPLRKLVLRPGEAGSSRIIAKVKGDALAMPSLPLVPPVHVQLQITNGECWHVTYDGAGIQRNDATDFKAAGPG
jgi:hypothetical protein